MTEVVAGCLITYFCRTFPYCDLHKNETSSSSFIIMFQYNSLLPPSMPCTECLQYCGNVLLDSGTAGTAVKTTATNEK